MQQTKALIFGSGGTGRWILSEIRSNNENMKIIGFLDNDKCKHGMLIDSIPVLGDASILKEIEFDQIIIASLPGYDVMRNQLLKVGINDSQINRSYIETQVKARLNFLHDYATLLPQSEIPVAEGGVFQGEFAKEINKAFPESPLYLFDTFEGFDARDISIEKSKGYSEATEKHLSITSEELVLSKLPYKEKTVIRKGYFPQSTSGLEKLSFKFVNLDFDLYKPTLEGLRFFYPRIIKGGCILIHDYFTPFYKGVAQAITDFQKEQGYLITIPIGDHCSLCIIKRE